jgi:UDP-N-acetyl-D-glucosamine dehydrogenase
VNIGLVNEIALLCRSMDIDVWEVIDAAKTKPFGFMPFYPGPGLGGHCIPIDPFYFSWKAKQAGLEARFIELAGQINGTMPRHVVGLVADALNDECKAVKGSRLLVMGVAYKANIDDVRESPALDIMELLHRRGAEVSWYDPHVPALHGFDEMHKLDVLTPEVLRGFDAAVIVTTHAGVDHAALPAAGLLTIDTRNALKGVDSERIFRL